MKKPIRWWRVILYILTAVGFVITTWWYVSELNAVFANATAEQIIESVDFMVFSTRVTANGNYEIINTPIIYGFACIAGWPVIIGMDYILRNRDQHSRNDKGE